MSALERYCFIVHWFDSHAQLNREYQLFFYSQDNSVEMFDIKQRRMFLKRTKHDQLKLEDLYIGAAVNLFSRQLYVIEYGDDFTISNLQNSTERILMIIKPHAYDRFDEIIDHVLNERFTICRARMLALNRDTIKSLLGPESRLGGSRMFGAAQRKFRTSRFANSTLAIIRPHAVNAGLTGKIISAILSNGFQVTDLELFHLEGVNAQEFLEVYKGVVPEYHVRPKSLRALFGVDEVRNAIHCTDLPEDGPLEFPNQPGRSTRQVQALFGLFSIKTSAETAALLPLPASAQNSTGAIAESQSLPHTPDSLLDENLLDERKREIDEGEEELMYPADIAFLDDILDDQPAGAGSATLDNPEPRPFVTSDRPEVSRKKKGVVLFAIRLS
ncbi:hypothetical protein BJ742DRAFT_738382 [Cladochytrium replicatum]|nr:hypothetical protein BJ742DRAFT_738382 [Cladochytrium replicatum]